MAYTYSFFDNQIASAEQLNKWVSLFVTDGIADEFSDGVPYSLSKLNSLVRNNCSAGVVPKTNNSLKVSLSGNTVQIAPGIAFFADGSVLEVTATELLTAEPNKKQFVYLKSDVTENRAYPAVSEYHTGDNTVLLAEISADGTVTDRRVYAKGKVPSFYASDAFLPGYTEFVIDKPGDYLLSRGSNSYTKLFFTGRQEPRTVNQDESPALVFYRADLADKSTEGIGLDADTLSHNGSAFSNKTAWWGKSQSGIMLLFKQNYGGKDYVIEGVITERDGNLYLTVSYTGNAAESLYLSNKRGVPMYCQVLLV